MMNDACKNWKSYKGVRRPRCGGGEGCVKCWNIYDARRYAKKAAFDEMWAEVTDPEYAPALDFEDEEHRLGELCELCWQFFIRGLDLSLGPAPTIKKLQDK